MKKEYNAPEIEIDSFFFEDVLTNSGIGAGDGAIDTLDSDEPIIE